MTPEECGNKCRMDNTRPWGLEYAANTALPLSSWRVSMDTCPCKKLAASGPWKRKSPR